VEAAGVAAVPLHRTPQRRARVLLPPEVLVIHLAHSRDIVHALHFLLSELEEAFLVLVLGRGRCMRIRLSLCSSRAL